MHAGEAYEEMAGMHPIRRAGAGQRVGDGILFLESVPFVTGKILHIDGGQSAGR